MQHCRGQDSGQDGGQDPCTEGMAALAVRAALHYAQQLPHPTAVRDSKQVCTDMGPAAIPLHGMLSESHNSFAFHEALLPVTNAQRQRVPCREQTVLHLYTPRRSDEEMYENLTEVTGILAWDGALLLCTLMENVTLKILLVRNILF